MSGISFNSIPLNIRVPGQYIEVDNDGAVKGLSIMPTSILVIGQKLAAGTQAPLVPVLINSPDQAQTLFGAGSQLKHMLEKFIGVAPDLELWAIAQTDNGAGAVALGDLSFTGPATAAGTLSLYIGGREVQIGVATGDIASTIATNVVAAINADADLPVTAAVDGTHTYQVDVTTKHKGLCGNFIDMRFNYSSDDATPPGVGITVTPITGGSGNPDVTQVLTAIGDNWYTDFVMAYSDTTNLTAMETELNARFGPMKMIDGFMYVAMSNTYGNLVTAGLARNNPHDSIMGLYNCPSPPYEIAAAVGAACAASAAVDPAMPVQTLPLPGILAPAIADRFTYDEQEILLNSGISTVNIGADGTLTLQRVITTYQTNAFGAADPSYLDVETLKTLAYLRYDTRTYIAQTFPRYKLADDGTPYALGQNVVTPSRIKAALVARFKLWETNGLVEDIDQFKSDLQVIRDSSDVNRVDALIPPNIINQFRVFAAKVQFVL